MRNEMTAPAGFARPRGADRPSKHRAVALELMACLALVASTLIAATVVTIGYARADTLNLVANADGGPFEVALLLGLLLAGIGGLAALMARGHTRRA